MYHPNDFPDSLNGARRRDPFIGFRGQRTFGVGGPVLLTPALLTDESVSLVNHQSESVSFPGSPSVFGRHPFFKNKHSGQSEFASFNNVSPDSSRYPLPQPGFSGPTHHHAVPPDHKSSPNHFQYGCTTNHPASSPVDCYHGFIGMATLQYSFGKMHYDDYKGANSVSPMPSRFLGSEPVSFPYNPP
jgi:hypothetical protein